MTANACSRCHGLLVSADLFDGIGTPAAVRCLTCGDVTDPIILQHRHHWREPFPDANPQPYDPSDPKQGPLA